MAAKSRIDPKVQGELTSILDLLYDVSTNIGEMRVGRRDRMTLSHQLDLLDQVRRRLEYLSLS